MSDLDIDILHSHLRSAPAPAPWYTRGPVAGLMKRGKRLHWNVLDEGEGGSSYVTIEEDHDPEQPRGLPFLLLKTGTFAGVVEGNRLLLASRLKSSDVIDIHLYRGDNFIPVTNLAAARKVLVGPDQTHHAACGPLAHLQVPRRLLPGTHPCRFAPLFAGVGEFMLPINVHHPATHFSAPETAALIIFRPADHTMEVVPQDWYNKGSYRQGLQWITRAGRDPLSGQIIGEGIRIGTFLLTPDGTKIERWLKEDAHHMP